MIILTVYTPTYNRRELLKRQYESLCRQTDKRFIWQVIDDGSTDDTASVVKEWMGLDNGFEIRYFYKENQGVHTARDAAYRICDTELLVGVDSDDFLDDNAVEEINECWKMHHDKEYAGIIAEVMLENGQKIELPRIDAATFQELLYKYKFSGDTVMVLRVDIIKKIPDAPVFEGEKLVGESYKWIQLPNDKPFVILPKPLFVHNYLEDGYTRQVARSRFRNARGFRAVARQHIISAKYLKVRIKGQIKYIAYSILLKDRAFLKNSPRKVQTVILLPFGLAAYIYMMVRWGQYRDA